MNRLSKTYLTALIAILNAAGSAYAAPDEVLYGLCGTSPGGPTFKLVRMDIAGSGVIFTDVVTLDNSTFDATVSSLIYNNGTFYVRTGSSNLYTLDTATGDGTLIGTLNVGGSYSDIMSRNPSDGSVWIEVDNTSDGTNESIAQVDLANAEVDVENAIALPSPRFFTEAFFDGFGQLYGMEISANTSWEHWLFGVNLSTGALSPTCAGSYYPCWEDAVLGGQVIANPDTYQFLGVQGTSLVKVEMFDSFVAVTAIAEFPYAGCSMLTFAPNVQSEPGPPLSPVLTMVGMCEIG